MKKIIFSIALTMTVFLGFAQGGFGPAAGNISVSLQMGKAEDFSGLQTIYKNQAIYTIYSPTNTTASTGYNSLVNMIGVEGKYFIADNIAVRLSGMGLISTTPAQQDVPGVADPSGNPALAIPAYADVPSIGKYQMIANIGGDYYFGVGNDRIHPYGGAQFNFHYGQQKSMTLQDDDLGERVSETYGLGGSIVGGVDYYVAKGFYLGIEIKAFNYMYSVNRIFPQPGMEGMDADNHSMGIFSNPMFKLGFTF